MLTCYTLLMTHRIKTTLIVIISIVLGTAATAGAIFGVSVYLDHQYASLHDGCAPRQTNHKVVIDGDKMTPEHTSGKRCETLTITNHDDKHRMLAFGVHNNHVAYDGISEYSLSHDQSVTVTLVQTGNFIFHDHMDEAVAATLEVSQ